MRTLATVAALTLVACTPSPKPATPTDAVAPAASSSAASASADSLATAKGDVTITPIHHGSLMLQVAGKTIHVDPALLKGAVDYSKYPKADFVLITDIHFDHMDPAALDVVATPSTTIVVPPAVAEQLKGRSNLVVLKNGETKDFGLFGLEAVPMYNLVRGPEAGKFFHDKGRGDGYVVTFGDKRMYISGDTECTPEMKALTNIDVAFLCMNVPYTMPPAEAAVCVNAFKPKVLYPYHYAVPGGASSNLDELTSAIDPAAHVEVRKRDWYAK
jgi:L-ascorbate metabolism protein UlaG (beta-lactamase superfamily)